MTVFTGIILYLLIWWLALFCVLPIGRAPTSKASWKKAAGAARRKNT